MFHFKQHHMEAEKQWLIVALIVAIALVFFLLGNVFGLNRGGKEANLGNDGVSRRQPLLGDLVISRFTIFPSEVYPNEFATLAFDVTNQGEGTVTRNFWINFIDADTQKLIASTIIMTDLSPGGTTFQSFVNVRGSSLGMPPGDHYIMAIVDSRDEIEESVEYNNTATAMVTLKFSK